MRKVTIIVPVLVMSCQRVRVMKNMPGQPPDDDDRNRADESPGRSQDRGGFARRDPERVLHPAEPSPVSILRFFARALRLVRQALIASLGGKTLRS